MSRGGETPQKGKEKLCQKRRGEKTLTRKKREIFLIIIIFIVLKNNISIELIVWLCTLKEM